jgi:hypothetical protein
MGLRSTMGMYVLFGVKTRDIEEARGWLEELLKLPAEGRFNEYEGDYYKFKKPSGEEVRLCSGVSEDEDGEYPTEEEFPDWALLAYLDDTSEDSEILHTLDSQPERFSKLSSEHVGVN